MQAAHEWQPLTFEKVYVSLPIRSGGEDGFVVTAVDNVVVGFTKSDDALLQKAVRHVDLSTLIKKNNNHLEYDAAAWPQDLKDRRKQQVMFEEKVRNAKLLAQSDERDQRRGEKLKYVSTVQEYKQAAATEAAGQTSAVSSETDVASKQDLEWQVTQDWKQRIELAKRKKAEAREKAATSAMEPLPPVPNPASVEMAKVHGCHECALVL